MMNISPSQKKQPAAAADHGPSQAKPSRAANLGEILQRIDQRLRDLNLSERGAARAAGLSPAHIRTMRQQYAEGRQRGASIHTITGLARALKAKPEWLISGVGPIEEPTIGEHAGDAAARGLHLAGTVAAGVWTESGADSDQPRRVPVPPDPRYPADCQCAYEVRGTSIDRVARPGDFFIVVDRHKMDLPLRSGDLVIMTQFKEGGLQEVTARRYKTDTIADAKSHEFRFESNDPRYSSILVALGENAVVQNNESVHLGGLVVAVYRPLV